MHVLTGYVLCEFDAYWMAAEPENVMAFPTVKADFLQQLKSNLAEGTVVLKLNE